MSFGEPEGARRLNRVQALFAAARRLPSQARREYLANACGGDGGLQAEVEALLAHDGAATDELRGPAWQVLAGAAISELRIGDVVGKYRIEAFLARGGTGHVYVAADVESGREVALKVIAPIRAGAQARERLQREARAAASVSHPHVVELFGAGEDESRGLFYCAMRRVRGPTLADVLEQLAQRGHPPGAERRRQILQRVAEVASGLAALHAVGLVHRDVKPQNIILDVDRAGDPLACPAVLVDLGLVSSVDAPSVGSTLWASLDYAAPEHLLGMPPRPTCDVFALGVVMHDLLAGRLPASRGRPSASGLPGLRKIVPDIDRGIAAIVTMATDLDPGWRYPEGGTLARDLHAVLDGSPVMAAQVPRLARLLRRVLRGSRRRLSATARAAAWLIAGAALLWMIQHAVAILSYRHSVARAWEAGDLPSLAAAVADRPSLAGIFDPAPIRGWTQSDAEPIDPITRVLATGQQEGWGAAVTLAARFLERDGLSSHPVLARFLLESLHGPLHRDALRSAARVCFERPDRDAADSVASGPLRAALHAALSDALEPEVAMDAVVALAGCGDATTIDRLLAASEQASRGSGSAWSELGRVTMHALANLLRRLSLRTDGTRQLTPRQYDALLEQVRIVQAGSPAPSVAAGRAERAAAELVLELALCRRGQAAVPRIAFRDPRYLLFIRAASRAVDLRAQLHAGEDPMPLPAASEPAREWGRASDLGFAAALLDDPACTRVLRDHARQGRDPAACSTCFDRGFAQGVELLRGRDPTGGPDPDSHLGTGLDDPSRFLPCTVGAGRVDDDPIAGVSLCHGSYSVVDPLDSVALCNAALGSDELDPGATYVRLAAPGSSVLRWETTLEHSKLGSAVLRLWAQQGTRAALPWDGDGAIDVFVDGEAIVRDLRLRGTAACDLRLPIRVPDRSQRLRFEVRLSAAATTTVRLYRLGIFED